MLSPDGISLQNAVPFVVMHLKTFEYTKGQVHVLVVKRAMMLVHA